MMITDKIHSPTTDSIGDKHNPSSGIDVAVHINPALENRVWRRLDLWVLPVITMFHLLSFLDRTNFGNARVAGLQKDLKMTNIQYCIALTVTYIPYLAAQLPCNLLLKAVGPNLMLPTMLTLWGVVTTLQGVVHTYHGLLACRFFLGLLEGGVFPSLVLYLSFFYPRQRLQWRISAFFSSSSISGAFSGLLAFGIINMNGVGKRSGWAWIFMLEGLFTILFGLLSFALLPASPETARFFNEEERTYVLDKLREDGATGRNAVADEFSWREVRMVFHLPQVWFLAVLFFWNGTILYGMAYFTPSIVQGLGFTAARAQLMSVPPFAVSFVFSMVAAYVSDRYHCRGLVSIVSSILCVIGLSTFFASSNRHVQYGSLLLVIPGTYTAAPTLATWSANNVAPHTRRATAVAISFIMTNLGGILTTWLFGSLSAAPKYTLATKVLLSFSMLMVIFTALNIWYLYDQNQKKKEFRRTQNIIEEGHGLGDKSASFDYLL